MFVCAADAVSVVTANLVIIISDWIIAAEWVGGVAVDCLAGVMACLH